MRVRVLLFAALREAVGQKQLELELPADATLAELIARLESEHELLVRYRGRLLVRLNEERAALETQLGDGDEVALLPPVSGGSDRSWIDTRPLSMDALLAEVTGPEMGGVVTFTGIVRNEARGAEIDHLEYEAYAPMAERELRKIRDEAASRDSAAHPATPYLYEFSVWMRSPSARRRWPPGQRNTGSRRA